jgi:hypothetical protein
LITLLLLGEVAAVKQMLVVVAQEALEQEQH